MINLANIGYSIGERILFSNVDLNLNPHDRFGLVGANGTGKTTLLRIISGDLTATEGTIKMARGIRIGYLPQQEIVLQGNTLVNEVLKDFNTLLKELSHIRNLIAEKPHSKELLRTYQEAEDRFHGIGGYGYESEAYRIIAGLGFQQDDYEKPVEEFSSGWQMRIVLSRILLNRPDGLLFDEPTNHLDIESIQWLENYLQNFKSAMIIVSHDRYFLDKVLQTPKGISGILEIDFGRFRKYRTDYTGYLQESQMRKQRLLHLARVQEKRIDEIKDFIARNKANKSKARIVRSREKYLERLVRIQVEAERKKIKVQFPLAEIHSPRLVELKKIIKIYDGRTIFSDLDLTIKRGEKIALIGKNGAGKSTLCRIIAGHEPPSSGERWSSERLRIGAFTHEIIQQLKPANTVIEELTIDASLQVQQDIRKFLGLFLFSGDDVLKRIAVLSGGEKTRLIILKAMLEPTNLLIFDEPTYHLDRDSIEAIAQAIASYEGAIVLVTHNRDLISGFATRIIELKEGRLNDYPGDYPYYLWKKKGKAPPDRPRRKKAKTSPKERLRQELIQREIRYNKLRAILTRADIVNDPRKSKKLFEEYQRLTAEIENLEKTIESL